MPEDPVKRCFQMRRDARARELLAAARESIATVGRWMPWYHAQHEPSDELR